MASDQSNNRFETINMKFFTCILLIGVAFALVTAQSDKDSSENSGSSESSSSSPSSGGSSSGSGSDPQQAVLAFLDKILTAIEAIQEQRCGSGSSIDESSSDAPATTAAPGTEPSVSEPST